MPAKVLLVDDHKIIREGLRAMLDKEQGLKIVGEAEDGRTAIKLVRELSPDLVVMDIGMPDLTGIEATRQITAKHPNVKVIALSMHSDKRFVSEMLAAGASGYLLKDCAFDELSRAIHTVLEGRTYLSPDIAGIVVEGYVHQTATNKSSAFARLTDREREVLQLIAEGEGTKQIATRLHISIKTVETHRQHVMGKLNIFSVAELTKYAVREGLTSLEK
jgi:DNA-binding NarL/FixJ family response regulator